MAISHVGGVYAARTILIFVTAFVIYELIVHRWFWDSEYLVEKVKWESGEIWTCLKRIIQYFIKVTGSFDVKYFSAFGAGAVMAIIGIVSINKGKWKFIFSLLCVGMMASPFILAVYMGTEPDARTQFSIPIVSGGLLMIGRYLTGEYRGNSAKRMVSVLAVGICIIQIMYNIQLQFTDSVRQREDVIAAEWVIEHVEQIGNGDIPEKPVVFVGKKSSKLNALCKKSECYGWSSFEWDYSKANITGATRRIVWFIEAYAGIRLNMEIDTETLNEVLEISGTLESFPSENAICELDEAIVIKLSE